MVRIGATTALCYEAPVPSRLLRPASLNTIRKCNQGGRSGNPGLLFLLFAFPPLILLFLLVFPPRRRRRLCLFLSLSLPLPLSLSVSMCLFCSRATMVLAGSGILLRTLTFARLSWFVLAQKPGEGWQTRGC